MMTSNDLEKLTKEELVGVALSALRKAEELERRVDWFNRQLFGKKSEVRCVRADDDTENQLWLGGELTKPEGDENEVKTIEVEKHPRSVRGSKRRGPEYVTSEGLRFGAETPVKEVVLEEGEETRSIPEEEKEYLPPEITYKLAQHKSAFYVEKIVRPKVKIKGKEPAIYTAPLPPAVIPGSIATISFLVGLLISKYCFHLPLYRLHQMLKAVGIVISRMTLTTLEHRLGEILTPLANAIHGMALRRRVLIMDETPHKVWVESSRKLELQYMWMICTEHEVFFAMGPGRTHQVVYELLGLKLDVILVTDGYDAYDEYENHPDSRIIHAYCWTHFRRYWIDAEKQDPTTVATALDFIGKIYKVERKAKEQGVSGEDKKSYRLKHAKPIVDAFHDWLSDIGQKYMLLPKSPVAVACNYGLTRWNGLNVFLQEPDVPLDTNEGEREMRPHAVGRKNWLFNMSEKGSDYVANFYTVLQTCKLNGVDPHAYLSDVLPLLAQKPTAADVEALTPLEWKKRRENSS